MTVRYALLSVALLAHIGGCRMLDKGGSSNSFCSNEVNPNMMAAIQQEQKFSENEEVFFVLKNATMCSATSATPKTFYVKGRMDNGKFSPESSILGEGTLQATGQSGWLEFGTAKFFPMHTAKPPVSPFVEGHMTEDGFVPSMREIK